MIPTIKYPSIEAEEFIKKLALRAFGEYGDVEKEVYEIINRVRKEGDKALVEYTRRFDFPQATEKSLNVLEDEVEKAYEKVDKTFIEVIREAIKNVTAFHERQKEKSWFITESSGMILGQIVSPVSSAGIYVPGGKGGNTPLISSLIMGAVPAKIAGVSDIAMVSPPRPDGTLNEGLLVTAKELGINRIHKIGSAWAIAGLAFGTESISKVDVIVGPGNIYVTIAKKLLSGLVGIDLLAGPSEVLIIADESANPEYITADLLSQAEHDSMASSILITNSEGLAREVRKCLSFQLESLPRKEIATESLNSYGAIFIVSNLLDGIELSNRIAPEHLEIQTSDPWSLLSFIKNAGAIFLGAFTPEPLGDYFAGPNHVLPTAGTARFASALGVHAFTKKTSLLYCPPSALASKIDAVATLARAEGLEAHARSIEIRKMK